MKSIDYTKYPLPRIRHHANPVLYFPLSQHKVKDLHYPPVLNSVSWNDIFANGKPADYLDVGTGLGKFLIDLSLAEPDKNVLGFEVRANAVEWTNGVLQGEGLTNGKVLWYSAVNGFSFIANGSIEKIFYFFPDPWPKKRHHKRRAFSVGLLDEFFRVLKPDGVLYIMTDVPEVDEHQKEVLIQHSGFSFGYVEESEWDLPSKTYQEEFSNSLNIPFIRMMCRKKSV